jgi:hypothetical protein
MNAARICYGSSAKKMGLGVHLMPNSNEPSCWRAAAFTFAVLAGLVLVIALIAGGDTTAVALR